MLDDGASGKKKKTATRKKKDEKEVGTVCRQELIQVKPVGRKGFYHFDD